MATHASRNEKQKKQVLELRENLNEQIEPLVEQLDEWCAWIEKFFQVNFQAWRIVFFA